MMACHGMGGCVVLGAIGVAMLLLAGVASGGETVVVSPQEIDDILLNPGMGFTTFHSFEGDARNENYPHCSIAYFRWYWDVLEPEEGQYRWEIIDQTIEKARARGQTLALRVMPANGVPKVPQWLRDMGCKGKEFNDGKSWMPDHSDPLFLEKQGALVKALGERYDGRPDIDHVDIGSMGRWGEWHTSGTGMPMPPFEVKQQIVDWYLAAFKQTPLVMLIGDAEALEYAVSQGAGWRADCLGDMGGFSKTWNHMDFYPKQLKKANAEQAWQTAPVCFETCWTMQFWQDKGWDVKHILDFALKMHCSVVNNKSSAIPKDWWPAVNEFQKKMGYRLVLRRLEHPSAIGPGNELALSMAWENVGVAPLYREYPLAVQLVAGEKVAAQAELHANLKEWLPGEHQLSARVAIPADVTPGTYRIRLAFLDPRTKAPKLKLAIAGVDEEGWYWLSEVSVTD